MQIYILDISKCDKQKLLSVYDTDLEYRREKFDRAKNHADKLRIIGGSFLLSYAAKEYDIPYKTLSVSPDGRIFFEGSSFFISLSHKEHICALAVSDSPVGIDVEIKRDQKLPLTLRFFSEKENRLLVDSADWTLTFTEIWTRKEALFKAAQPKDYTITSLCTAENVTSFNGSTYEFSTFSEGRFVFSVCKQGEIENVEKTHLCI